MWEKYKWYIIGYILYVCLLHVWVSEEWQWGTHYGKYFIIWGIMIPLCLYIAIYLYKKNKNGKDK